MPVKKGSKHNSAERQKNLIQFIKKDGPVKSHQICAALNISRSSLSDDLKPLIQAGTIQHKGTLYSFNFDQSNNDQTVIRIHSADVRQWLILVLLSQKAMNRKNLKTALTGLNIQVSDHTLYNDLRSLAQNGYITKYPTQGFERTSDLYFSSYIFFSSQEDLRHTLNRLVSENHSRIFRESQSHLETKIHHLIPDYVPNANNADTLQGKNNFFTEAQDRLLQRMQSYNLNEKALNLTYRTKRKKVFSILFYPGLLVYSVETGRLYLIGTTVPINGSLEQFDALPQKQKRIIPLENIVWGSTSESSETNYDFNKSCYRQLLNEMFSISIEQPHHVVIRFQNEPYICEKIRQLANARFESRAKMELIQDNEEIRYSDTIRGLSDFARCLRQFGGSFIVEEPDVLRERVLQTGQKLLGLYNNSK